LGTERKREVEFILNQLENKIKKHIKETVLDEREDLAQDIKIKIMEKLDVLLEEEPPSIFDYVSKIG
jgi:hypothetical protein